MDKRILLISIVIFAALVVAFSHSSFAGGIQPLSIDSININFNTTGGDNATVEGFNEVYNFTINYLSGSSEINRVNITAGQEGATYTNFTINESSISDPLGWAHNVTYDVGGKVLIINWSTASNTIPSGGNVSFLFDVMAPFVSANLTAKWFVKISNTEGDTASLTPQSLVINDTIPPILAEVTAVPTPTNDNTPDYTFNSTEAGTITYAGDCNSTVTSATVGDNLITFNILADGTYSNCTITVTDAAGNPSIALPITSFTVDTIAPSITIINPDSTPAQSKTITASASEGTLYMRVDAGTTCDNSLTFDPYSSFTFTHESDNGKTVCYKAVDAAGNSVYSLSAVISGIDTTAPTIDAVIPIVAEATSSSGATVTITPPMSHDAVDGNLLSSCDYSTGTFALGVTTVTCNKTDAAGNTATSTFTVTVQDTTKPTITNNSNMQWNQTVTSTSWLANFTITDNVSLANYSVELNGANYTFTKQGNDFTKAFSLSQGSNYTVKAYANDTAGNEETISGWVYVKPEDTGDGGSGGGGGGGGSISSTKPEPTAHPTKQLTVPKTPLTTTETTPSTIIQQTPASGANPEAGGRPTGFFSLFGSNSILAAMLAFILISGVVGYYYFTRKKR